LEDVEGEFAGKFNKVFSNAALHWILADGTTRKGTIESIYRLLPDNGYFVAEMGGFGNVAEMVSVITAVIHAHGVSYDKIRKVNPWYFPWVQQMRQLLEDVGFEVEIMESEHRPTELPGHITAWLETFAFDFLQLVSESERKIILDEVTEALTWSNLRSDGIYVTNYVRLRFVAVKHN